MVRSTDLVSHYPELTESDKGVLLAVHLHPGAGTTAIISRHGSALKVRVAAPPTAGRANEAVAELVATEFGLKASEVNVVSGDKSRQKKIGLGELSLHEAQGHIDRILARPVNGPK